MNIPVYDTMQISRAKTTVGVNPQGGYVTSWQITRPDHSTLDILYAGSQLKRSGIPVLFPHFGKSEMYRMHGFGRDSLWSVEAVRDDTVVMRLDQEMIDSEARAEYPYTFTAQIKVELREPHTLIYSLEVTNAGDQALPIMPGLHPYWAIPHRQKISLVIDGITGFDATAIDWQGHPPDTAFDFAGSVTVTFPTHELRIAEITQGEQKIKYVVVWSQTPVRDPDFDFVCVEPVCGVHYGIEKVPMVVGSHQTWSMTLLFEVIL